MLRTIIATLCLALLGCSVKTNNAEKAFKYWLGKEAPKEVQLIKGQYYRSPHFTLEYELFLKFKADQTWFDQFVKQNKLKIDSSGKDWSKWVQLPEWFQIDTSFLIYAKDPNDEFESSRYFRDPKTEMCFVYETVGM